MILPQYWMLPSLYVFPSTMHGNMDEKEAQLNNQYTIYGFYMLQYRVMKK